MKLYAVVVRTILIFAYFTSLTMCLIYVILDALATGDVITIFDKQVDGWWQGEVNGRSGIFPGSYVEETQQGIRL